jgi:hypothetical protein
MSDLSDKQIQAQVSAIRRTLKNGAQHFAIRAPGAWLGSSHLLIDGIEHIVLPCVSDLQVREALLKAETEKKPSVLLCCMSEEALGDDVIDRLAKRRVFSPQVREMVAELFAVSPTRIDPRVLKSRVLMEALLDMVPTDGYPPVASGTLDLQTAWLTLLGQLIGERVEAPSLTQLLEWSVSEVKLGRLTKMDPELKSAFVDWFARSKGESIRFIVAAIDSGYGADLLAIGVALGLVFDPNHFRSAEHQIARGRLERYFQHREIDEESARAWFRASDTILAQMKDDAKNSTRRRILNRLDELLTTLGLANNAWVLNHSPLGLEQRYQQTGHALLQALAAKSSAGIDEVRGALATVRRHLLSEADSERLSRVEMACRLIRWLHTGDSRPTAEPFDAMVVGYHRDGGFIDWARNRLKETDESPEVQKAFAAILKKVEERAESFETSFAVQLQEWTRTENQSNRFILIENVLQEVVLPVAKQQPVLLLVLDGMSVAVFRQLLQDILRHDWTEIVHEEAALPRPVIGSLPSVTSISRRALFLGRLDPATNGTEEGEFKANDILFHGSGSQVRPQLFKIGDLSDEENGGVASGVRNAIADKKCRVVSVVLNAIDDHLDSGKQVDFVWTRNTIRGFRDLLRQASDAGRLVIMTSDHGHVLDFGTKQLPSAKDRRGDRFRTADGKPQEGELEFEGSRVYKATGCNRITLACSAGIRYGKDKRGYHGGANPQELVVPLAILSDVRMGTPQGWMEIAPYQPDWWRIDASEATPLPVAKPKAEKVVQGLDLFERVSAKTVVAEGGWISALLKSPIYQEQSKLAVRGAPADDLMTKLLKGLDTRGGTAVKQALAQDLGMPPFRVDGLIINVSRILNVDGYEVISFDRASDTVALNMGLLRTQFDLEASS